MTRRALVICGLLLLLLAPAAARAQKDTGADAEQLIRLLESRYGRMRGLAAEFEQT